MFSASPTLLLLFAMAIAGSRLVAVVVAVVGCHKTNAVFGPIGLNTGLTAHANSAAHSRAKMTMWHSGVVAKGRHGKQTWAFQNPWRSVALIFAGPNGTKRYLPKATGGATHSHGRLVAWQSAEVANSRSDKMTWCTLRCRGFLQAVGASTMVSAFASVRDLHGVWTGGQHVSSAAQSRAAQQQQFVAGRLGSHGAVARNPAVAVGLGRLGSRPAVAISPMEQLWPAALVTTQRLHAAQ